MENELQIKGNISFMGINLPNVYGGFGEDKKCILAKSVAEIHGVELKRINELIKNNMDEFEVGIDILDLKAGRYQRPVLENDLFTKTQYSNAKNIYLLSESGYMTLVMLMRTPKAKEIRKKLRKEYFEMREQLEQEQKLSKTLEEQKKEYLLQVYEGGLNAIEGTKKLIELETKELNKTIETQGETIKEQEPFVAIAMERLDKGECLSLTDINEGMNIVRGRLTKWAKEKGYLHKTLIEVNKTGKKYFKVYINGKYKSIGVTKEGVKLINDNLEEIRNFGVKSNKSNKKIKF